MLRDFYRDGKRHVEGLQASLMLLPEEDRAEPWEYFSTQPRTYMETYKTKGDQPLLERYYMNHAQRWQDILPGQIVSWKVDCCGGNVFRKPAIPAEARIVILSRQSPGLGTVLNSRISTHDLCGAYRISNADILHERRARAGRRETAELHHRPALRRAGGGFFDGYDL